LKEQSKEDRIIATKAKYDAYVTDAAQRYNDYCKTRERHLSLEMALRDAYTDNALNWWITTDLDTCCVPDCPDTEANQASIFDDKFIMCTSCIRLLHADDTYESIYQLDQLKRTRRDVRKAAAALRESNKKSKTQ
jgi:hypothetical protein